MSDLISLDALIRDIDEKIDICKEERKAAIKQRRYNDVYFYSGEISIARRIRRYVNMFAPAVDAVPVVRCKDCANSYHNGREGTRTCRKFRRVVGVNSYCSCGIREEEINEAD